MVYHVFQMSLGQLIGKKTQQTNFWGGGWDFCFTNPNSKKSFFKTIHINLGIFQGGHLEVLKERGACDILWVGWYVYNEAY